MQALKQYDDFADSDEDEDESTCTSNCAPSNTPHPATGSSPVSNLTNYTSSLEKNTFGTIEVASKDPSKATGARRCDVTKLADVVAERVNDANSSHHYANHTLQSVAPFHPSAHSISTNSTPVKGILKPPSVPVEVPVLQTIVSQGRIVGRFVVKKLSSQKKLNLSDTEKLAPDFPPENALQKTVSPPPDPSNFCQTMEETKGEILYKKSLALAKHAGIYLPPPVTIVESTPCKRVKLFSPDVPLKKPKSSISANTQNNRGAGRKQRISKKTFGLVEESPPKNYVRAYWDDLSPEHSDRNWVPCTRNNNQAVSDYDYSTPSTNGKVESLVVDKLVQDSTQPYHSAESSLNPSMPSAEASESGEQSTVAFQLKKQEDIIKKMSQNMEALKNYNAKMVDTLKEVSSLLKIFSQKRDAK